VKKGFIIAGIVILVTLVLDQWLKVHIKLNYEYGQRESVIGDWFQFHFVENPGMAFGLEFPFVSRNTAKMILTTLRLFAVSAIFYYLWGMIKRNVSLSLIISCSLIFAGAFGNIIDSLFYGLIFSNSSMYLPVVAEVVPFGSGYEGFMTGRVVDMLHLDLFTIDIPWFANLESGIEFIWRPFSFFAPIFNLADVAISVGVGMIIVFQRSVFQTEFFPKKDEGMSNELPSEVVPDLK
jgi:signal peptidase II